MGELNNSGHTVPFSRRGWKVTKGALVMARGKRTTTLYLTSVSSDVQVNVKLQQSRLGRIKKIRKQKGVSFKVRHVYLGKSP